MHERCPESKSQRQGALTRFLGRAADRKGFPVAQVHSVGELPRADSPPPLELQKKEFELSSFATRHADFPFFHSNSARSGGRRRNGPFEWPAPDVAGPPAEGCIGAGPRSKAADAVVDRPGGLRPVHAAVFFLQ